METIVVLWFVCGVVAGIIASGKGRSGCGWFILGLLLGPLALLGVAIASRDTRRDEQAGLQSGKLRRCPACAEVVKREATICRFCRTDLPEIRDNSLWGRIFN